ncbi:methyltransferase domain-containing protein [Thermosynechococcaceae cyanobacterium Okahandja]
MRKIVKHYWSPQPAILDIVKQRAATSKIIVEVGPGVVPFELATEFIDWLPNKSLAQYKVHTLDLNYEPLPYKDKSIDFIYCRHVVEDMYNPFWLCQEMIRVAKAGYIETPSPICECAKGVDGGSPPYRGYIHHRYLVWQEQSSLIFVPKYPIIEYLDFSDVDPFLLDTLNMGFLHWNTYFFWTDHFEVQVLQHDKDFYLHENYKEVLLRAIEASYIANLELGVEYQLPLLGSEEMVS